jgi:transposase
VDVLHERCAGVDIGKKEARACVRTPSTKRRGAFTTQTTTWGATTNQVLALRDHLLAAEVTLVVIEATSDYWKPFYYLLTGDLNVILVNARQVKNLPGRKTDVSDAAWLAQFGAHGLVRPSFVPDQPVRELRDLTRARTHMTRVRDQIVQRLEKLLEDTGINQPLPRSAPVRPRCRQPCRQTPFSMGAGSSGSAGRSAHRHQVCRRSLQR